jgi:hypothetical protein
MNPRAIPPTGYSYKSLAASGIVKTGPGIGVMLHITSSASLTIKLWDNTAASGTVIEATFPVAVKEQILIPAEFQTGLYIEFVAGTGSLTAYFI